MRAKFIGALLVACAVAATVATPAGAVVAETPSGPVSYLPLNGQGGGVTGLATPKGATKPTGKPPLLYHGGPVMHSQAAYAIFWVPSGYSLPTGYQAAIETYFQNAATDSGKPSNVYSVSAQYTDSTPHHASYSDTFGGSMTDTTTYPTSGTCAPYTGLLGETYSACISNQELEDEVESVVAAKGWPKTLAAEYYVVLPPHAGSCFNTTGNECFDKEFCAYHSRSLPEHEIYANISYSPGDPLACGVGEYPNGHSNGNVDDTLSSLSHEANESITDPLLSAWFDEKGFENGDECRNSSDDYGTPLGGSSGSLFNEEIGTGHYYLQQEWSNDIEDCAQRVEPALPEIANPGTVKPGESVGFDGSGSVPGSGGIESYKWDFGDGGTETGAEPSHTFVSTGEYTVTLTVEDDGEFTYSTSHKVVVTNAVHRTLSVSIAGSGAGTVTGSGVSCPGTCSHEYLEGESVTLTATPSSGSTFSGWSGSGCSGTGTCEVTMSADHGVTATFTEIPLRKLTVARSGTGSGTVTGSGISCGATCTHKYEDGESVILTAVASSGSTFSGWSGSGCSGTGTCEVTMSADHTVTATFTARRTLTVSPAGSGSGTVTGTGISCPGTCSHEYLEGETVTLTASPSAGSTFSGWSGSGCSGTGTCEVPMSADKSVTATFAVSSGGGGGGSSGGGSSSGGGGSTPPAPPPPAPPQPSPCRKGFRKATKNGKAVCVKIRKHHRHHKHH